MPDPSVTGPQARKSLSSIWPKDFPLSGSLSYRRSYPGGSELQLAIQALNKFGGKMGFVGGKPEWGELSYTSPITDSIRGRAAVRLAGQQEPYYSVGIEGEF